MPALRRQEREGHRALKTPTLRYRCPTRDGGPSPGDIIMGDGPRVRRAYRVLKATRSSGLPALSYATWRIAVEPMRAAAGRAEIEAGVRHWSIIWDRRDRRTS
jgi:hypothetical protein